MSTPISTITNAPGFPPAYHRWLGGLPGVLLSGGLAAIALQFGRLGLFQANGISALTLAIVLGMVVGNTIYARAAGVADSGVSFSRQTLLRAGIILYGLRLTLRDLGHIGVAGLIIDTLVLTSTFGLSWWLGVRVFGLDRKTAMLVGAGSSICGAAAVMAAAPVVRARPEQVAVAVSTVVVFGTLAIFLYPALYHGYTRYELLALSPTAYGIYAGSTIHEVAQVVAAGRAIAEASADTAVIAKMARVMMLAPFLIALSAYLSRGAGNNDAGPAADSRRRRILVPWFALAFIGVVGLNSLALLPATAVAAAVDIDTALLAMAMAALGLTTRVSALRTAGLKPLALGAALFAWLILGGYAINALVTHAFR